MNEDQAATPRNDTPAVPVRTHHWSLTLAGLALILALLYYGEMIIAVLCFSILLTFVLDPIAEGLQRLHVARALASLIAVLMLGGVLYGIVYFSYNEAQTFFDNLPEYSQKIRSIIKPVRTQAEKLQRTTEAVQDPDGAKNVILVRPATTWTDMLTHGVGSITEDLLAISFVPFLVYFFLTWQHHARSATVMLFPLEHRHIAFVTLGQMATMLRSFIVGNFLVGLFISTISMVVFAFLGIPFFYFIGFISGFLSLVPYLGVILAIVPPLIVGLGQIQVEGVIVVIVTVLGLHLFALNVLYPLFLGGRLKLNPLAVTIALLFWATLWGAVGLILAIPITAAMKIVFDHVEPLKPYAAWLGE